MQFNAWGTDTETTGLDAHKDRVTLVQIGRPEEQYVIDARKVKIEPIRPFFESREIIKIWHNYKFDYKMIKGSTKIECENGRDTFIAEKIMNAGRMFKGFRLDDVLLKYINVEIDKTLQKSFIGHTGEYSDAQIRYAADDVKYLLPTLQAMTKHIIADGLGPTFKLECDVVPAFGDMEFDGMVLDKEAWLAILEMNKIKQSEAKAILDSIVEPYVGTNLFGEVDINYGSPPQMVKLFERMRIKVREYDKAKKKEFEVKVTATDAKTLKKLGHIPFVKHLQAYRSIGVRINTFGMPYIEAINPLTGAIHPDFDQLGTETGRPAAGDSDVNPLNIPRDNEYRNCFVGRGDEIVESDDYSGCESRILAQISGDQKLIKIFRDGEDIHCAVATALYGKLVTKNNENKKLRTPAKSLNFG
jgi:DNA polymerase I-like protein with 3'-5' exonuclease and polymerase domains